MFWKKKKNDNISIQMDDDDRRASVRIRPMDTLTLETRGQQFEVLDISATGLSFQSDTFAHDEHLEVTLLLPATSPPSANGSLPLKGTIEILHSRNSVCHCQFLTLTSEAQEQLEQFILTEQKRQIRTKMLYSRE